MKALLVILSLVSAGLVSHATSIDRTQIIATVSGLQSGIKQVNLLKDGRLQVQDVNGKVKQIILSKAAAANLLDTAQGLSNVEIKDEMLTVVCAKISRPELSDLRINLFDADKNEYSNEMKLILTSQSCAVSHHVSPVEDYAVVDASELRRALLVLALNTVK